MQFLIHSRKTNQFLLKAPSMYLRASWHENLNKAKKYDTPTDAAKVLAALSETSKSHIVLWDGIQLWNVSESKA
jgi:hypothetical protein